ncbi:hypothetical protein [Cellulomonas sp. KRMCY2]|uniref:hypothetical protein n=1 Tax=Cellulomonas sp. KRMCY2 TaxID=1304865 RepID=UPI0004AD0E4E|nr:hypothetical protein [Cellulomonas sp. KRMCY2]
MTIDHTLDLAQVTGIADSAVLEDAARSAGPAASIHTFDSLSKGAPAPTWLHDGIVDAWGLDTVR